MQMVMLIAYSALISKCGWGCGGRGGNVSNESRGKMSFIIVGFFLVFYMEIYYYKTHAE